MIALFALIFRMRGQTGFGDFPAMVAWGFFSALLLHANGHSTLQWLAIDFTIIAALFTLGARPGWSKDCWPAWNSSNPDERLEGFRCSMERSLWFFPLLAYVAYRGDPGWVVEFALSFAFGMGFALCIYYCKTVADRLGFNRYGDNSWPVGELMIGAWLGLIQYILSL